MQTALSIGSRSDSGTSIDSPIASTPATSAWWLSRCLHAMNKHAEARDVLVTGLDGIEAMSGVANKTYSAKPGEVERKWIVIDGEGLVVGRLAALIATRLRGKHKPTFTPHVDMGDHVIVVNADKVVFSGNKYNDKRYYRHTGYPGGIKERSPKMIMEGKFPERIVTKAVERMLNKSKQRARLMRSLRVYKGAEHPHEAQNPEVLDVKSLNAKNVRV